MTDISSAIRTVVDELSGNKIALALSGGIDSAIVAKYLPEGTIAYTFRCCAENMVDESHKAGEYARACGLVHKVVDVTWEDYLNYSPCLMKRKGAPIHSIEPQIYKAALTAKADGVTHLLFGESADNLFGGLDGLLSCDWTYIDFIRRCSYLMPDKILKHGVQMLDPFEKYRTGEYINYYGYITEYFYNESNGSYDNACSTAGIYYISPFTRMILDTPLDLKRIRNGEPKYMLRELFSKLYNTADIPPKLPMPRAVKQWLKNWSGPSRPEFVPNCTVGLSADQKWMVFILEMFLDMIEE
jgi:asparagine synthetase B (glutamine-hydrolysing)